MILADLSTNLPKTCQNTLHHPQIHHTSTHQSTQFITGEKNDMNDMIEKLGSIIMHLLNWIAALFAFSLVSPAYEQIAGMIALPLAILALACAFLLAALSLAEKESAYGR